MQLPVHAALLWIYRFTLSWLWKLPSLRRRTRSLSVVDSGRNQRPRKEDRSVPQRNWCNFAPWCWSANRCVAEPGSSFFESCVHISQVNARAAYLLICHDVPDAITSNHNEPELTTARALNYSVVLAVDPCKREFQFLITTEIAVNFL